MIRNHTMLEHQRMLMKSRSYKDNYTDKIKCAIYGRVSTKHEAQLSAFDNQLDWYELLLRQHPMWEVVEVYSDQASGTNTKSRKNFNRMIEDAMQGKFQLLITREVCRFARNTVDSLSYVRSLNLYDVEVFFVNDNIWSRDPDGELRLTIFAALAQDEARKTSERCRSGQFISREKGILYGNNAYGYTHLKGEKSIDSRYIINEQEADTVRLIYDLYLSGLGMKAISTRLVEEGRRNKSGIVKWDATMVSRILANKLYCGYVAYGKSYKENFLSKRVVNRDTSSHIYVKSDKVEPIISEEDFEKVQEMKKSRKKHDTGKAQCKPEAKERYTKKLVCGECGKTFKKFLWHKNKTGATYGYTCRNVVNSDHERLCGVIDGNVRTYETEIQSLIELIEDVPDEEERKIKLANIRKLESILLSNNNLTILQLDDEFVDAFVARIEPYEGRKFKWYLNIGSGKGWGLFDKDAYELYDYWVVGFNEARRYRKANNQYLRENQWEDIQIEVYIRTK